MAVMRPLSAAPDARVDAYFKPVERHWLRGIVFADLRPYTHVMLASFVANMMALAGIMFSMQVYDRVIPAQSLHTLFVLLFGVLPAIFLRRVMRNSGVRMCGLVGTRAYFAIFLRVVRHPLR